jgi:uncharacterized membrane protein YfcA
MGSLPAAFITVMVLNTLGVENQLYSDLITSMLGVALILTALSLFFLKRLSRLGHSHFGFLVEWRDRHVVTLTVITGLVLGVLVTITSVGAGALGMVILLVLYPRVPAVTLVGTDIAHAVPLTLIAGMGHAYMGTVDYSLLASLLLGSLPGIYLGSHVGGKIPDYILRPILSAILIVVGIKLMMI